MRHLAGMQQILHSPLKKFSETRISLALVALTETIVLLDFDKTFVKRRRK